MTEKIFPYELPENWQWTTLKNVAKIFTGNSINEKVKQEKYFGKPDGLIYIATKDIGFDKKINYDTKIKIPESENFKVAPKDTTLLCIEGGSAGRKIGFTNQPVCFVNKLCAFVSNEINSKLIYFFMQTEFFLNQFNKKKHGLIGGVSVKDLSEIIFPLPPLDEQKKIVERIESLFSKLDAAKEKVQTILDGYELRRSAILHKAFTGELTKNFRAENNLSLDDWQEKLFSEICDIVRGGSPRPAGDPKYYGGNIPFMKVADITNNLSPYVYSTKYTIKKAGLSKTRMVKANTLLLTNSGATLGVPAICMLDTTLNDGIAAFLNLDSENLMFYYYFWSMKTQELRGINKGAAQPNLNTNIIGAVEINLPPLAEQKEIVRVLDSLLAKEQRTKEIAENILQEIDLLKKSILAQAFRGKL
ncbi:MAG: restriction endonuclease subunit S [Selenomonadaceae bacterium]|nr:restriction endonuclease subunit S [Selenomonadaceae bacterium]